MASFSVNCPFLFPNFAPTWWKKLGSQAATSSSMGTLPVNFKSCKSRTFTLMNIIETQNLFVRNFIYRNKRDRVLLEITNTKRRQDFLLKLNHQILDIINNDLLTKVDDNTVDVYKSVCQDLKVNGEYKVLIISNYKEIDGKIKSFYEAFEDLKKLEVLQVC